MAMNWDTFKKRVFTAVIFVCVMLLGLLTNEWMFFIIFSIVHFGCWIEFHQLMKKIYPNYQIKTSFEHWTIMLLGWCLMLYSTSGNLKLGQLELRDLAKFIGLILVIAFLIVEIVTKRKIKVSNIAISGLGFMYISISWAMLIHIRSGSMFMPNEGTTFFDFFKEVALRKGFFIPLVLVSSIWINDTMAYIIGSSIGKTPLSLVSPHKTWEGTIGGFLCSVGSISLFSALVLKDDWRIYFIISTIAVIAGTFGDLLESRIKREANVKDSGLAFPGHGGFLDRFDSLLLAVPSVWLFLFLYSFISQIF
ncbi:MAG: phosphatidate cytidylyltransferase [Chitinophagaceae bacterium]|nr:phosphatidate cytidylyltransferase [Chitinophagaceae bacterium]